MPWIICAATYALAAITCGFLAAIIMDAEGRPVRPWRICAAASVWPLTFVLVAVRTVLEGRP